MKAKLTIYEEAAVRKVKREFGNAPDIDDWRVIIQKRSEQWRDTTVDSRLALAQLFMEYSVSFFPQTYCFCLSNGKKCVHVAIEIVKQSSYTDLIKLVESLMRSSYSDAYTHQPDWWQKQRYQKTSPV